MKLILGTALALILAGPALAAEKKEPKLITVQECNDKMVKRDLELLQIQIARLEKQMAQLNAMNPGSKALPKN